VLQRAADKMRLRVALTRSPVTVLTGPRQAGKSTLAREVVDPAASNHFDLENPADLARMTEPALALRDLQGTVVIDEAQQLPGLFPILRVLVDSDRRPGRFLVLGSASPSLVGLSSESLAGRVELVELPGLRGVDVGPTRVDHLWQVGGLPPSFTADATDSAVWRDNYIATFLSRDLAQLGVSVPAATMRRFWTMLAHYHGQTWNGAELARALGVSQPTVRRYVDALTDALMIRQLQPWFTNTAKRQVRSPKVYLRDSGLLHRLLGLTTPEQLLGHPKVGASWEGFVLEQLIGQHALHGESTDDAYFWGTQGGAEIDLLLTVSGLRVGVEIKRTDSPTITPSIRNALVDLHLERVVIAHGGDHRFALSEQVEAIPARDLVAGTARL
jgi:uncharacterized protein